MEVVINNKMSNFYYWLVKCPVKSIIARTNGSFDRQMSLSGQLFSTLHYNQIGTLYCEVTKTSQSKCAKLQLYINYTHVTSIREVVFNCIVHLSQAQCTNDLESLLYRYHGYCTKM